MSHKTHRTTANASSNPDDYKKCGSSLDVHEDVEDILKVWDEMVGHTPIFDDQFTSDL